MKKILIMGGALAALITAAPAHAEATATVKATTQRMSDANLTSPQDGSYNAGDKLSLVCSKRGENVKGFFSFNIPGGWDNLWYRTSDNHYVADVDIETGTLEVVAPDCSTVPPVTVASAQVPPQPQQQPQVDQPHQPPQPIGGADVLGWCTNNPGRPSLLSTVDTSVNWSDAYSWRCVYKSDSGLPFDSGKTISTGVDMNDACVSQFGAGAYSEALDPHDAHSWRCFRR